ncbi:lymphotoxin-alpha-like [Pristis pectinata]|uniref:lymphotoxin-alpha-like n=1 Tax=Pristis pectinata TaxID=685728 RepID=UPI00223CC111|nr:lymphotoxin-alpha-like [Pristis pectinata]
MAKVGPKMVVTLTLWCVALTIGFLGMACYLVTAGGWRKSPASAPVAPDNPRTELRQYPPFTQPGLSLGPSRKLVYKPSLPNLSAEDNLPISGKTNNTRQQLTLPTHTDSPQPCGKKTDRPAAGKFNSSSVKWESSRKESTLQSMNYSDGFIIIAEPGHYYVYSQVSFVGASCENGSEVLESTVLYLQHSGRSSQHPLELMEAAQSVCEGPNNKPWYHSLRQGGVFQLSKDTHLSMKISPFNRAELEHHKTYFGAFKIQ